MEVRYLPDDQAYRRLTTQELRKAFVLDGLFRPGAVTMVYCDADRAIVGGAVPGGGTLRLQPSQREMAASTFTERRELGVVSIGGPGVVSADGTAHTLEKGDMIYLGRGVREITFAGGREAEPALFYFVSYPAHAAHPTAVVRRSQAHETVLGTPAEANRRMLRKYIHPGGVPSCQLVMGMTELEAGCVWNTMPPHTHHRRSEVYLYTDLAPDAAVVHLMGTPGETRSLIMRVNEAVISPGWSIHCGAGTTRYSFIWAMGGENQDFADMDGVAVRDML